MNACEMLLKKFPDGSDSSIIIKNLRKNAGDIPLLELCRFVPIILDVSNVTRDFMLRLPSLLPGCAISPRNTEKSPEFMAVPQIGASGEAYDIWKNFVNTAILTKYRLSSLSSGFNFDSIMPGIIKSDFTLLTSLREARDFILRYEKKWNSKPGVCTQEWEELAFAKRLLDILRENAPEAVGDIIFQLDPDITSEILPSRNWIRVAKETGGERVSFTLHIFTTFAFHMLAERPVFGGGGEVLARHIAEAGDMEVSGTNGAMFLSISSDSRMDIFSGNPNRHGLRIYGEWEFHSLQRAAQAYLKAPSVEKARQPRKYNVTMIFQNAQDLEEFCFIFANS